MATKLTKLKQELFENVKLRLGHQIVDIELDVQHLEVSLKQALGRYHQRSSNAVEESYAFLPLKENIQEYTLDDNILEVRQVFRRTIGSTTGEGASNYEPFEAGYMNTYLMQSGRVGGLLTYELFAGYQELAAKMFGGFINFTYNPVTKKLTIIRRIHGDGEEVLLWIYNKKPLEMLLAHHQAGKWFEDFTLANCKIILGEARSKFSTIAGPQGGTTLNGAELKAEGQQKILELNLQLSNYEDGGIPLTWVLG
jgi:hypothetical protein